MIVTTVTIQNRVHALNQIGRLACNGMRLNSRVVRNAIESAAVTCPGCRKVLSRPRLA